MNKKKILVSMAIWALFVLLTLLIFFVVFDDYSKVRIAGLVFILLAETLTLAVVLASDAIGKKSEKVMFNAGIFTFTGIYLVATLIISVIFMMVNRGEKWLALLNGIILILFAICFILLFYMSNVMGTKNRKVLSAIASVKRLEIAIQTLKNDPNNKEFSAKLEKLYEAAKYCDCSVFCETDERISLKVNEIENLLSTGAPKTEATEAEDNTEAKIGEERANELSMKVNRLIDESLILYKTRSEEVKLAKGGGF